MGEDSRWKITKFSTSEDDFVRDRLRYCELYIGPCIHIKMQSMWYFRNLSNRKYQTYNLKKKENFDGANSSHVNNKMHMRYKLLFSARRLSLVKSAKEKSANDRDREISNHLIRGKSTRPNFKDVYEEVERWKRQNRKQDNQKWNVESIECKSHCLYF